MAVPTGWAPSRLPINPGHRAAPHAAHPHPSKLGKPNGYQLSSPYDALYCRSLSRRSEQSASDRGEKDSAVGAMDVYISEEYVAQRRAERRAARIAAAARCGGEEKARADSEQKRWTPAAAWAEKGKRRPADGGGNADTANVGGGAATWLVGEDAVSSYFSA